MPVLMRLQRLGVSAAPFVGHKLVPSGDLERNRD